MDDTIQQPQQQQQAAIPKPSLFSSRKFLYIAILAIIVVIAVALLLTGTGGGGTSPLVQFDNQPVPQSLLAQLSIPSNVSASVRTGFATNFPAKIANATPLTLNGKPEVLYIGAEFCPYCAMQRWALVIALMRFGNFTGLEYMTSSAVDAGPNTPTFTFVNATYSSPYIAFVSRELTNNKVNASTGQYTQLQQMNASQQALYAKYNPSGSIPFTDYANVSKLVGANYNDPTILAGMNWSQIAAALHDPSTAQAQAFVGSANLVTAQICALDNNTPASVCGQSYIKSIESQLG